MNFNDIKLIIWDLDDTFWQGILSEGEVNVPKKNIELVKQLTNRGIINSICSKNDESDVNQKLKEIGLEDYFVFNSINWNGKGPRIKKIIEQMSLRENNVLFIDDNPSNLNEAKYYCKNIMVASPDILKDLFEVCKTIGKDDRKLSRLKQYKILEEKRNDSKKYETSEDFLYSSNIQVDIRHDSLNEIERIHELLLRTNQLNFTKLRPSIDEFTEEIKTAKKQGYIKVKDNYGDYGIVGFYLIDNNGKLRHFLFSCRTMGMGIEQYVYAVLGFPKISIIDPVSSTLNKTYPKWINNSTNNDKINIKNQKTTSKILMKGPCDMKGIADYIGGKNIDTEFFYVDDLGRQIENQTHIVNILNCTLNQQEKSKILSYNIFAVNDLFESRIFSDDYDVIIFSMVSFYNFGVYRHLDSGLRYAVGQNKWDLTKEENWDKYISGEYFNGGFKLEKKDLKRFSHDFEKINYTSNDIIEDLHTLCNYLKSKKVILILGNDKFNIENPTSNYINRELQYREFNQEIKKRISEFDNLELLEVSKFINSKKDLLDSINHYSRQVLYNIASELTMILNSNTNNNVKVSYSRQFIKRFKKKVKRILNNKKIKKMD